MDTKLIQQYGESINSYRMRTARQKIRMQYEDFDKCLIQLDRYESKLYQQKKDLGWQLLDKPYQKGWVRFFILRQDIVTGRYASFFEGILKKINTNQYSWRKDFKRRKRRGGKKNYSDRAQNLLKPNAWEFNKMEFTAAEKDFFNEVWEINSWKQLEKKYVFRDPGIFVLKVTPFMIDKVKMNDAQALADAMIHSIEFPVDKSIMSESLKRFVAVEIGKKYLSLITRLIQ